MIGLASLFSAKSTSYRILIVSQLYTALALSIGVEKSALIISLKHLDWHCFAGNFLLSNQPLINPENRYYLKKQKSLYTV